MSRFSAFLLLFLCLSTYVRSQIYDPVKWSYSVKELKGDKAELIFTATIEPGWHIYAQDLPSDQGPLPTEFTFESSPQYSLKGGVKGGKYITKYDPNFAMDLNFYEGKAVFTQVVQSLSSTPYELKGELSYMVCNEEMCLPPEYLPFSFKLDGADSETDPQASGRAEPEQAFDKPATDLGLSTASQIYDPVSWRFRAERATDSTALILATAYIAPGWHLYAAGEATGNGPLPTEFLVQESNAYTSIGTLKQPQPITAFDPVFKMEVSYFTDSVTFAQQVALQDTGMLKLEGYLRYMVCNDSLCLSPENEYFSLAVRGVNSDQLEASVEPSEERQRSNWGIFIVAFLSGFAALLTPCVFPMIPLTVSFFTKQSKTRAAGIRNASIYGISIIAIYVLLGVLVTAIFGANSLSKMATDPWFNLFFFVLLVVFAISFLGAFEITLPNSWINKADARADRGGLVGIFFMAFTLALVSFSCTGPIVGTLIVEAASKGGTAPVIGMLGFSLAIALPFGLFAAFPGWLNSLPQSGGWLNSVKVVLGFLELALAFKFLSNADMVLDWHLLERELFIAIWIVIFALLTLYLIGKLRLPHDSPLPYVSVTRVVLAIITGTFTLYLLPGLWGAPLNLISAFPPPLQYSESPMGIGFTGGGASIKQVEVHPDKHLGPQNLYVFHEYDKALAYAKKVDKPLMLDFTGKACVNCRKMEQDVWSNPEIKRMLKDEVVLASLYVDFNIPLPEAEQITVDLGNGRSRKLRTVGDKWAAFQEKRYHINAQPYYVLLDHNEEMLIEAANYQDYGEVALFDDWLRRGLARFADQSSSEG